MCVCVVVFDKMRFVRACLNMIAWCPRQRDVEIERNPKVNEQSVQESD